MEDGNLIAQLVHGASRDEGLRIVLDAKGCVNFLLESGEYWSRVAALLRSKNVIVEFV